MGQPRSCSIPHQSLSHSSLDASCSPVVKSSPCCCAFYLIGGALCCGISHHRPISKCLYSSGERTSSILQHLGECSTLRLSPVQLETQIKSRHICADQTGVACANGWISSCPYSIDQHNLILRPFTVWTVEVCQSVAACPRDQGGLKSDCEAFMMAIVFFQGLPHMLVHCTRGVCLYLRLSMGSSLCSRAGREKAKHIEGRSSLRVLNNHSARLKSGHRLWKSETCFRRFPAISLPSLSCGAWIGHRLVTYGEISVLTGSETQISVPTGPNSDLETLGTQKILLLHFWDGIAFRRTT
jgi:hypothetical protein